MNAVTEMETDRNRYGDRDERNDRDRDRDEDRDERNDRDGDRNECKMTEMETEMETEMNAMAELKTEMETGLQGNGKRGRCDLSDRRQKIAKKTIFCFRKTLR